MEKRFNQSTYAGFVDLVEKKTGKIIDERDRRIIARGADEIDLVRSGLEETMINSYEDIRELYNRKKKIEDLRTAAFVYAIDKIADDYLRMGIFP